MHTHDYMSTHAYTLLFLIHTDQKGPNTAIRGAALAGTRGEISQIEEQKNFLVILNTHVYWSSTNSVAQSTSLKNIYSCHNLTFKSLRLSIRVLNRLSSINRWRSPASSP